MKIKVEFRKKHFDGFGQINKGKIKFPYFYRPQDSDKLPPWLPTLKINEFEIKISSSKRFFENLVGQYLNLIDHMTYH